MQSNDDYERLYKDSETKIAECDEEISKLEQEIEVVKTKKQGFSKLREALAEILGSTSVENTHYSVVHFPERPLILQSENSESFFLFETPNGLVEIPTDAFKDLKINEAAIKFLKSVNYPQKTSEIVNALLKCGFESPSINFAENVRGVLRSASKGTRSEIIWKNKLWQLADWVSESPNTFSKPPEINKLSNSIIGSPKWNRTIGDAAEDILKNEKGGLHLDEIRKRLAEEEIYPTIGSLDVALRQDGKKRFELVSPRTYGLVKKTLI